MRYFQFILLLIFALTGRAQTPEKQVWKIDSIQIKKNWRTRHKIILRELQFNAGETIDRQCLDNSISQIWNIGNFAQVDYSLDSISPDGYLLNITAKDQFNFVPIFGYSGNKEDRNISLGINDNNFLGRNIDLDIVGNIGTFKNDYKAEIRLPRQLLYKNMTLSFQVSSGSANNYRYENGEKASVIAYRTKQFSGGIGNPFHTDFKYTFSPNLSWNLFQHRTDTSLVDTDVPFTGEYEMNYLSLSVGESMGLINRIRHQHNGYLISGGYGIGIGIDRNSPVYHSFGFGASVYKTLNRVVELSAAFSTGYTTTTAPSLIFYLNSGNIKGLINGQESGQGQYHAKITGSFTYLYTNWFALEHSVYTHFGKAGDHYFEMFTQIPRISVSTGLKIWTPMIPWLAASVHFTYMKGNNNWFHLQI